MVIILNKERQSSIAKKIDTPSARVAYEKQRKIYEPLTRLCDFHRRIAWLVAIIMMLRR